MIGLPPPYVRIEPQLIRLFSLGPNFGRERNRERVIKCPEQCPETAL